METETCCVHVGHRAHQVDPWDHFLSELYGETNDDQRIQILEFYRQHGYDIQGTDNEEQFCNVVNRVGDKKVEFFEDVFKTLKMGCLKKKIKQFKRTLRPAGIFLGREEAVEDIKKLLEKKQSGVNICGMGGNGKTTLARHVCYAMQDKWKILWVDLRNKSRTADMLRGILLADNQLPDMEDEQLKLSVKQFIQNVQNEKRENVLIAIDDCDDVKTKDPDFEDILLSLLQSLDKPSAEHGMVRTLFTSRERLAQTANVKKYLKERRLDPLCRSDAINLLTKCSDLDEIEDHVASAIVTKCACSPLAVTVVSDLLKSRKFTPCKLIQNLELDEFNITKGLGVVECIKRGLDNLDEELQRILVCLSVFQSSPFSMQYAFFVCQQGEVEDSSSKDKIWKLEKKHLIEKEAASGKRSLQPLVYQYITEWKKPKFLQNAYEIAVKHFVKLLETVVEKIVRRLNTSVIKGLRKMEDDKVHILKFYDLIADHPDALPNGQGNMSEKDAVLRKCVSDLTDLLLSNAKKRRMFKNEAERATRNKNDAAYILWNVEEADVFVMLQDKPDIALDMLKTNCEERFPDLRGLDGKPVYPKLVHALFHKVKGLCFWKQFRYGDSINHMEMSLKFLQDCKEVDKYQAFIARNYCYLGQIYIDKGDIEKAEEMLTKGYTICRDMIRKPDKASNNNYDKKNQQSKLHQECTMDVPVYYTHFATIKITKANSMPPHSTERQKLLDSALEDLEKGMELDHMLKLDRFDCFYAKKKLRADIYMMKGLLEEALAEAEKVHSARRELLQPPHFKFTSTLYQVAKIYLLNGEKLEKEGKKEEALKHWRFSNDNFRELEDFHLKDGSVPLKHPLLQQIKEDHIKVVRLCGERDEKNVIKFYQALEREEFCDVARSRAKAMEENLWTPMEIKKEFVQSSAALSKEFGNLNTQIEKYETLVEEEQERMLAGETSNSSRRDSGYTDSISDMESVSYQGARISSTESSSKRKFQLSFSCEDNVFTESGEPDTALRDSENTKRVMKHQKHLGEITATNDH